ncbi:MAG TPA: hypothetical protein VIM11_19955 [Tepidisphaeraceae bacterium]
MEKGLKKRIDKLLADSELAVDETANGLMDRGDFRHFISEFIETTRVLLEQCDELERERDASTSRLQRKSHLGVIEPMSSLLAPT